MNANRNSWHFKIVANKYHVSEDDSDEWVKRYMPKDFCTYFGDLLEILFINTLMILASFLLTIGFAMFLYDYLFGIYSYFVYGEMLGLWSNKSCFPVMTYFGIGMTLLVTFLINMTGGGILGQRIKSYRENHCALMNYTGEADEADS